MKIDDNTLINYNAWPLFADHILDHSKEYYDYYGVNPQHNCEQFIPEKIKKNDIVFVKTDFIIDGSFYHNYFHRIDNSFKLITAISSYQIGNVGTKDYLEMLKSDKIIKWFCTNPPNITSDKIIPIPIGFQEPDRIGGNQLLLNNIRNRRKLFDEKEKKLFLSYHTLNTNFNRRENFEYLSSLSLVDTQREKQNMVDYFKKMNDHQFVLCLEGAGNDTVRNYESLLVGSIPIMKISTIMPLFVFYNIPGVFVDDWKKIKEDVLDEILKSYIDDYKLKNIEKFLYLKNYEKLFREGIF